MPAKVVDASVVAAWCFQEPRVREAAAIMRESDLHAPLLMAYELSSIARRKSAIEPDKRAVLEDGLRTALALPIHWSDVDHLATLRLALEADLTTYDACYLYLARKLRIPLATFDQRLARASS